MEPVERDVEILLTKDEALVLSHWIHELQEDGAEFPDRTVWMPLWAIGGYLQARLPEIFAADYDLRLADARARLLDRMGDAGKTD